MDPTIETWRKDYDTWRPIRLLGQGGYATVLEVFHLQDGRRGALKILQLPWLNDPRVADRFRKEVRLIQRIKSPFVVKILASGKAPDGANYFVTELVLGQTLAERIKQGPLSIGTALQIGVQIAKALSAAHREKIVHRDLKPANILLENGGADSGPYVKVIDFGVAKWLEPPDDEARSLTTEPLGTWPYMSSEQWVTPGDVDHRADLYSLGLILYECLSGKRPYRAESQHAWTCAHTQWPVPDLETPQPLPPGLSELIKSLMAKNREQRPKDADTVIDGLLKHAAATSNVQTTRGPSGSMLIRSRNRTNERTRWTTWGPTFSWLMLVGFVSWESCSYSEAQSRDLQCSPSDFSSGRPGQPSEFGTVRLPAPTPAPVNPTEWIEFPWGKVWRNEVSREEYRPFHDERWPKAPYPWDGITDYEGTKQFPVSLVDAAAAQSYCAWKHGPGSRLLTPTEWSRVASEVRRPELATGQSKGRVRQWGREPSPGFVSTRDEAYAQGFIGIVHLFGNVSEFAQEQGGGSSTFWICGSSIDPEGGGQASTETCRKASPRRNSFVGIRCMVPNL